MGVAAGAGALSALIAWMHHPRAMARLRRAHGREFMLGREGSETVCLECVAEFDAGLTKCPQCGWTWGDTEEERKQNLAVRRFKS